MIVGKAELVKRVNRMYWDSNESVNQIAERLDLSKGALYGLIEPAPADGSCPDCGERLSFGNRTSRDRGVAECATCPRVDRPTAAVPTRAPFAHAAELAALREPRRWSGRTLAGCLIVGAFAGALIVSLARRR